MRCIQYSVYAVLGVLYLVYAVLRCMLVLGVCCTQCELLIIAWRDREG